MIWVILGLILGYLIGSISPSYILGKAIKGIDIRTVGTKNAGTTNAFQQISKTAGIITGAFDFLKGMIAFGVVYLIALHFGFSINFAFVAAFLAIFGHDWPFYMQFKGGKGAATTWGLMIMSIVWLVVETGASYWILLSPFLIYLILLSIFKKPNIIYFFFAPLYIVLLAFYVGFVNWTIFISFLLIYVYVRAISRFKEKTKKVR